MKHFLVFFAVFLPFIDIFKPDFLLLFNLVGSCEVHGIVPYRGHHRGYRVEREIARSGLCGGCGRVREVSHNQSGAAGVSSGRAIDLYRTKGYDEEWIAKRIKTIQERKKLTDVWKENGIESNIEYAILTNEPTSAYKSVTFSISLMPR